ncbi:hypothetical protein [Aeromonas ichthyocola]
MVSRSLSSSAFTSSWPPLSRLSQLGVAQVHLAADHGQLTIDSCRPAARSGSRRYAGEAEVRDLLGAVGQVGCQSSTVN